MPRTTVQADREPAKAGQLVKHYGAIGPAAVAAALVFTRRVGAKQKSAARTTYHAES